MIPAFCWNPIEWLMNTIFEPLLKVLIEAIRPLLEFGVRFMVDLLMASLADIFFDILVILLKFVSFFSSAFYIFAGAYNVALETEAGSGVYEQSGTFILQYLMENMGLMRIYWMLTLLSTALCLIFTGIEILRSMNALSFDPKKTVGKIWGRLGRTLLTFLVIPSMMLFGIELSTVITGTLVGLGGETTSVDNMIFLAVTMEAAHDGPNGVDASFTDELRGPYFRGEKSYEAQDEDGNRVCAEDFNFEEIDFVTGYILSIFLIFILFGAALFAVRRLFEIMLLYVTAPLFVSSIPLDEGKRFEGWRNMFVAKLVSVYGLIIMMTLYLNFVPTIMGGRLDLSGDGLMNSMLKTFLLLGGAFALKNSHSLLLGIISPEAAQAASGSVLAGIAMGTMLMSRMGGMLKGRGGGKKLPSSKPSGGTTPAVQHATPEKAQQFTG